MAVVRFNYADVKSITIGNKKGIKEFLGGMFQKEGKPLKRLDYIFCSDEYLLVINRSHLQHDYYTDIITFDLSEGVEIVGEVYISVDRVKENASQHSSSFQLELLRVMFHGVLHLVGYRDKKKSEITLMREKEDYYLRLFDVK
jgi:probable rRNA maturation factor